MASQILDSSGNPFPIVQAKSNVVPLHPFMTDAMANIMSGRGTSIDKVSQNFYYILHVDPRQAEIAYRTDWLMRKIVDIPPLDMTRAWRAWQTDKNNIEALEKEERRLHLKAKVKRALILSRLWGGGAIVIGNGDRDTMQPLKPGTAKGSLRYLNVYSRYQLTAGNETTDPESLWCGQPEKYTLTTTGKPLDLHPSRVVAFVGQKQPEGSFVSGGDWFWGDPIMQSVEGALKNAGMAQDGFAALIDEASVDVLKVPGLTSLASTEEYETRMLRRLAAAGMGKSTWRKLVIDGEEEWNQHQVTWAGMPDMITSYLQIVAGAADIPITRLLGQSPKGLQSTGDGEERDYKDMIAARQEELVQPALDRIDELLIPSALGSTPSDVWWSFNSLDRLSPKDAAEIESKRATTVKTYADTGLFPDDALAAMAQNAVIESGQWPGSEKAFEASKKEPDYAEADEGELLTAEEVAAKGGDPTSAGAGGSVEPPRRAAKAKAAKE
jgi:phage-related protein (TIGR01555 family)